jgi:hypothetical protein
MTDNLQNLRDDVAQCHRLYFNILGDPDLSEDAVAALADRLGDADYDLLGLSLAIQRLQSGN